MRGKKKKKNWEGAVGAGGGRRWAHSASQEGRRDKRKRAFRGVGKKKKLVPRNGKKGGGHPPRSGPVPSGVTALDIGKAEGGLTPVEDRSRS